MTFTKTIPLDGDERRRKWFAWLPVKLEICRDRMGRKTYETKWLTTVICRQEYFNGRWHNEEFLKSLL